MLAMTRIFLAAALLLGPTGPAWAEAMQLTCARDGVRSEPLPSFLVAEIQAYLAALGYRPGPADGILGPQTRASIGAFKADTKHRSGLSTKEHQLKMLLTLLPEKEQ
jgi:hypothetical protein